MRSIAGVLFDLDNTLIDRDLAFVAWANAFVRDRLLIEDRAIAAAEVEWMIAMDNGGYGSKPEMFAVIQAKYPEHIADPDALASEFTSSLRDHIPALDQSTLDLLASFVARGIPWGIVTNGSPTQLKKIERIGLNGKVPVIVSGIIGIRKPETAIFHAAATEIGVAPENILFVGDNVEADILGAFNAGMATAWMHRGREWPVNDRGVIPDHTIGHVADIRFVL